MFKALLSRFKAPLKTAEELKSIRQIQVIESLQAKLNERRIFELRQAKIIQDLRVNYKIANDMAIEFRNDMCDREEDLRIIKLENVEFQDQQLKDQREIEALKAVVSNLRKQKVYAGQKFYDQNDNRAPTVYLCARWNDWYIVRQSNQLTPSLITAQQWQDTYGHLIVLPQMNSNLKNLS